jgi:hypothetical protein
VIKALLALLILVFVAVAVVMALVIVDSRNGDGRDENDTAAVVRR